jgi:hypothetical protein
MRLAIIGLVTVAAALVADVQAASVQNESFFRERYCSRRVPGGRLNCAFKTLEQCKLLSDLPTRYCIEDPWWHGPRPQPATQAKSRGRNG